MYRSRPLVTLAAQEEIDAYLAEDAGTRSAAIHSVKFVKNLPQREPVFNANKSFKELYDVTRYYDTSRCKRFAGNAHCWAAQERGCL